MAGAQRRRQQHTGATAATPALWADEAVQLPGPLSGESLFTVQLEPGRTATLRSRRSGHRQRQPAGLSRSSTCGSVSVPPPHLAQTLLLLLGPQPRQLPSLLLPLGLQACIRCCLCHRRIRRRRRGWTGGRSPGHRVRRRRRGWTALGVAVRRRRRGRRARRSPWCRLALAGPVWCCTRRHLSCSQGSPAGLKKGGKGESPSGVLTGQP